jgi:hypothetical protein
METLEGFPCLPAHWLRRAKPGYADAIMETLEGFPCLPAHWLRRAKPGYADAIMLVSGGHAAGAWIGGRVQSGPRAHDGVGLADVGTRLGLMSLVF